MDHLTVVTHPLVQHKLTLMREKDTPTAVFRQLLREISQLLAYEVTRELPMEMKRIETPLQTKVIVLTMHKAEEYVRAALAAGVDGYVLKDDSQSELLCAIDKVFDGQIYLSAGICTQVVTGFLANGPEAGAQDGSCSWASLTVREREVLKLVADGKRNKEIAECLSLSVKTVEKHRVNLMKKLDVRNASELTAFAMKNGLI